MSVTHEQIQALRDKFETAVMKKICISKSTLIGLRTDEEYRNSTLSGHDYQGDWEFFLAGYSCSLAERDADKALIAEQAKRIAELDQKHCGGALMEREEHHVCVVNKLLERIAELETVCAESYQVVGVLADAAGVFETSGAVSKAMDNLSAAKLVHQDVLPFVVEARTVTVKLPQRYSMLHRTGFDEPYHTEMVYIEQELVDALAAAGITLVVGE
ncbi:dtDP-6-deoxy-L-hexose 3-0-methyltransferase [Phage vB_KsaM-C1]|nr:dtDP-6-deoxy-L-hexose 3-0-methyltransferase [Phage vB_KsaM-C1]